MLHERITMQKKKKKEYPPLGLVKVRFASYLRLNGQA